MTLHHRFTTALVTFCLLLATVALPGPAAAEPVRLKMATLAPLNTPWMDAWERTQEIVTEKSPVPIELVAYPGGVMGDEPDAVKKLKFGQLQMVGVTVIGLAKLVPEILVLALPYLYQSADEVNHILKTFLPEFEGYAEKRNYKLLQIGADDTISPFTKELVETEEDVKNQKVWRWTADPIGSRMIEILGLNGVSLGVPEVRVGLQTGMIDTVFGSPLIVVALQWQDMVNYYYPDPVAFGVGALIARKDAFKKVPAQHQAGVEKIMRDALAVANDEIAKKSEETARIMLEKLLSHGIKEVDITNYREITKNVRASAEQVWQELVGEYYPQELLDKVRAELARHRATPPATP